MERGSRASFARVTGAMVAAIVAAAATAGCAQGAASATPPQGPARANGSPAGPLTEALARRLPPGVFYILGGPLPSESNVWQVSPRGGQHQFTRNPRGFEIDTLAATRAGILLSDALFNIDELARWTRHGAQWLHPPGQPRAHIDGQAPDLAPDGELAYLLPPGEHGNPDFTIWTMKSFTSAAKLIYQQRDYPAIPIFGPDGQLAIVGLGGNGQKAKVRIISRAGKSSILKTGFRELGFPLVWGQNAPGFAIPSSSGTERVFLPGGNHHTLPHGWLGLAWNPAGTQLLVQSHRSLGIWSFRHPNAVKTLGLIRPGFEIDQICWLAAKAPL